MRQHPPTDPQAEPIATRDEIVSGWKALSREDKVRLEVFANQQARMRQKYAPGITGQELLGEAARRAFDGSRAWRYRKVKFLSYMLGIIRSIGGDLKRTSEGKLIGASDSEDAPTADGESEMPAWAREAGICLDSPEEIAIAKQQFAGFQSEFDDDEEAWCILECIAEDLTGTQIQQKLGITETDFEAARKRIARRVHKYFLPN